MGKVRRLSLCLATCAAVLLLQGMHRAGGTSSGISGLWGTGCATCHGSSAAGDTTVFIAGPPQSGGSMTVTVSAPSVPTSGINQGGFNLKALAGTLFTSPSNSTIQLFSSNEAGHTSAGNNQRSWSLTWQPPPTPRCRYDFAAAGLAANGDGINSSLDHWNLRSTSVIDDGAGDTLAPTPTIVRPAPGNAYLNDEERSLPLAIVAGTLTLRATAADDRGIDRVEFHDTDLLGTTTIGTGSYDEAANDFSLQWNTQAEIPGPHTLNVRAVDCGGNQGDATISLYIL